MGEKLTNVPFADGISPLAQKIFFSGEKEIRQHIKSTSPLQLTVISMC